MVLNEYDLTKPHEIENVDSTEGPADEDEAMEGKCALRTDG